MATVRRNALAANAAARRRKARNRLAVAIVREAFAAALGEVHAYCQMRTALAPEFRPRAHANYAVARCMPTLRSLR